MSKILSWHLSLNMSMLMWL